MSLTTDKFFWQALKASDTIVAAVEGRIFNTGRTTEDEKEDKVPYIIISYAGMTNESLTKDEIEGEEDDVSIEVLCVHNTREQLAILIEAVREQIRSFWYTVTGDSEHASLDVCPTDWTVSADSVEYDWLKPCYYQTLRYQCTTER